MSITLASRQPGLMPQELHQLQRTLGFVLLPSYAAFLQRFNGAIPETNIFEIPGLTASISSFLGRSPQPLDDLEATYQTYFDRLPEQTMPVALAAGGNLIVLNMNTGKVYFWDHENEAAPGEQPSYSNMHLLAETFDDFMESLMPYNPNTVTLDPAAVISVKLKPGFAEKFKNRL